MTSLSEREWKNKIKEKYKVCEFSELQGEFKEKKMSMCVKNIALNIQSWPKISAPLVNMIKEGCEN